VEIISLLGGDAKLESVEHDLNVRLNSTSELSDRIPISPFDREFLCED